MCPRNAWTHLASSVSSGAPLRGTVRIPVVSRCGTDRAGWMADRTGSPVNSLVANTLSDRGDQGTVWRSGRLFLRDASRKAVIGCSPRASLSVPGTSMHVRGSAHTARRLL